MPSAPSEPTARPVGHAALRQELGLNVPAPAVESYVVAGSRRTVEHGVRTTEYYPRVYAPDGSIVSHLRFALRHEPTDLGVLVAALKAMDPVDLEDWVRREPRGAFSRRAWFLYETFTGRKLDLPPAASGNYVPALDPARHLVADRRNSPRHRVIDNLLGGPGLCPTIRRTPRLRSWMDARIGEAARELTRDYDPIRLARAVSYLYTKETRSSFAIEGERPGAHRSERFVAALRAAPEFDPLDVTEIVRLQNAIVDPRYAEAGWRLGQTFVGQTLPGYREQVHLVCPRPQDVPGLMDGWMAMMIRLTGSDLDPVAAAAAAAFAFVFVHPFEDGNGRLHRFLIHHVLARRGFGPPGIVFPVSASILRDRASYDAALESFSRPLLRLIDHHLTDRGELVVEGDTADLYRYFDATALAEYLYERVADTVKRDLKDELDFVAAYDRALAAIGDVVDMPDRKASLFVLLCLQNGGRLSRSKRAQFEELSDREVDELEAAIGRSAANHDGGVSPVA